MAKYPLIRVEEDASDRCQSGGKGGQCPYQVIEGTKYCGRHGGNKQLQREEKVRIRQYRLQVWQERLAEFSESSDVKSLRDEIGILRLVMEATLNQCEDSQALLLHSHKISDLATKIEKIVVSCDRIEKTMGLLLDKAAALTLANKIVEIISDNISDPIVVDKISGGIITALGSLTNENHTQDQ